MSGSTEINTAATVTGKPMAGRTTTLRRSRRPRNTEKLMATMATRGSMKLKFSGIDWNGAFMSLSKDAGAAVLPYGGAEGG